MWSIERKAMVGADIEEVQISENGALVTTSINTANA